MSKKVIALLFLVSIGAFVYSFLDCMSDPGVEAEMHIKSELRSPSSFKEIKKETIWKGRNRDGHTAYIVKIEYEAMNGFGGINRECSYRALWLDLKKHNWVWNVDYESMSCNDRLDDSSAVNIMKSLNDFSDK